MGAVCSAFAYATELSERTFAASAKLIGAATFALISDIAARSGSSSPAISFSSSRVSALYCCCCCSCSAIRASFASSVRALRAELVALLDRRRLLGVGVGDRVVAQHVEGERGVDRGRHVGVDQRHRGSLRQLLASELVQLLAGQLLVALLLFVGHVESPSGVVAVTVP